ncbi:MAG: hypothetical protein E4H41_09085 [Gemmatimonadales bacterium]|jgi:hypothetical protein|nr:MAG: hypothetical protein E4H41_09085 [Gemmatimonadales bacterium]
MPLVRVLLGWMATWILFLVWEAVEGKVAGGTGEPGRKLLRRAPGAYFIEALLFTLIAGLWFASLGHGGWWLVFGLMGLLVEWAGWMRVANMDDSPFPPLVHVLLGGLRGAAAGGILSLILA